MATLTQQKARAAFTISGNSPKVEYPIEGNSQTFKKGALLYLSSSGRAVVAVRATGTGFDTIRKLHLGLALKDAQNSTSPTTTPVHVANADTVFIANVINRTSAATSTISLSHLGKAVLCSGVLASQVYIEVNPSAAATIARVLGFVDAVGDKYGRVLWQLLPGARLY